MFITWFLKMRAFWDRAPCSLVEVDPDVSEDCTASIIRVVMEAVCTSETSVYFNKTTWCYIPEDSLLHPCHCEKLKSCMIFVCFNIKGRIHAMTSFIFMHFISIITAFVLEVDVGRVLRLMKINVVVVEERRGRDGRIRL
jgi:hypothetical protein